MKICIRLNTVEFFHAIVKGKKGGGDGEGKDHIYSPLLITPI